METTRYNITSYDDLLEIERKVYKELGWLDKLKYHSKFPIWKHLQPGADMLNKAWKKSTYWHIPQPYVRACSSGSFAGEYEVSIHVRNNEDFMEYFKHGRYKNRVQRLLKETKPNLLKRESSTRKEVEMLNNEFADKLEQLADHLIFYIEKHSVEVNKYEPHFSGSEDGKNTRIMIELVEDARFAFRGVMCGSIYVYEWLIQNYIDEDFIDELWGTTCKILEKSKEYLTLQMAIEHYNYPGKKKFTDEEVEWFLELIRELQQIDRNVDSVNTFFKTKVADFIGDPRATYFWGGFSVKAFGEAFEELYELKFNKSISSKRIITHKLIKPELEKMK